MPDLPEKKAEHGHHSAIRRLLGIAGSCWWAVSTRPFALFLASVAIVAISIGIFGLSLWSVLAPVLIIAVIMLDGALRPGSRFYYPTITHGPRHENRIALSFDDGPDPDTTPKVLDILSRHQAHATFFVIGRKLAAQPELARRIRAERHEVGNHTWQHSRLQNLRGARSHREQIQLGTAAIAATGQSGTPLFRPPMGLKSPHLAAGARKLGIKACIAWSLHARDTRGAPPEKIAHRILEKVRPGDIILLHDGHDRANASRPACAEALESILQGLAERGLAPVTIKELLSRPVSAQSIPARPLIST
jgi:peptidoglycan/xylan/chitin deacetylase (PgdA/CDA1 family)